MSLLVFLALQSSLALAQEGQSEGAPLNLGTPQDMVDQANLSYVRGDCELAQYLYQKALEVEPNNSNALLGKGRALVCQGAIEAGIAEYKKIAAVDPNNLSAYIQLAIAQLSLYLDNPAIQGNALNEAYQAVQQAERINAADAKVANIKGVVLYQQGNLEAAKVALESAVNLAQNQALSNSDLAQMHINLGRTYRSLEDLSLALSSFRRAVILNPSSGEAHSLLGETYFMQGKCEEGLFELTQGANLNPASLMVVANLAIATFECGDEVASEGWFKQALEIDGVSLPPLYSYLSRIYVKQGRYDDAIREAQKGALLPPNNAEALYWLGYAYQVKGDLQAAKEAFGRALELDQEFTPAVDALRSIP
ncbi:MAG: tetratricopeptide repeat protein [Deinococcales bacterium]